MNLTNGKIPVNDKRATRKKNVTVRTRTSFAFASSQPSSSSSSIPLFSDSTPFGTVTTSSPRQHLAVAISGLVEAGSRNRQRSCSSLSKNEKSPPSVPLITIFVMSGKISMVCARTSLVMFVSSVVVAAAVKQKEPEVSLTETSASEWIGSSRTLANTWGSRRSLLEATSYWEATSRL